MNDTGKEFMRLTQYAHLTPSLQQQGSPPPPIEMTPLPHGSEYSLERPDPAAWSSPCFAELADARRSVRHYATQPLQLHELAYLLWYTQGVQRTSGAGASIRTVPSAGARHALETFVLVNNVDDITPGLYRYRPYSHALTGCREDSECARQVCDGCLGQSFVLSAAAVFIWVADTRRMTWRYSERGFRYLHLDAGHLCQNLYLAAESIGCGACAIAAFDDTMMNELLGCDGDDCFTIYCATVGRKQCTDTK